MLRHLRRPVSLSVVGTDLPIWSQVATAAMIYQKDGQLFDLVLKEPSISEATSDSALYKDTSFRLLWLEISPDRVIMTMQETQKLSYRHFWATGVYGISRYWLHDEPPKQPQGMQLRNYTRSLKLKGHPLPEQLSIDYELWAGQLQLGRYILNLDIEY
ncbi:hypothetical protein [Merismopedia glauca]|uniref:Uncharacterized protein n=1 Tax=Merismopedia glauca CCAP 1448/3 TaxID=1296344 RepID=A0A2T1CAB5_9CYAN|nr:hypothetical protein [Merismopedia glauca]PSB05179.1 hypothetical protein C7B64_00605 [Merismopedia glauca CCAP 1448/3]